MSDALSCVGLVSHNKNHARIGARGAGYVGCHASLNTYVDARPYEGTTSWSEVAHVICVHSWWYPKEGMGEVASDGCWAAARYTILGLYHARVVLVEKLMVS